MSVAFVQKRKGYLVIGGTGVILAAGYLGLSLELPLGGLSNPGAAIFPLMAGTLFLIASIATVWEGLRMQPDETSEFPVGADLIRLALLVSAILLYLLTLPWLGQLICSILFCTFVMRILSANISLPGALVRSTILMLPVYYLFIHFFRVPMPRGIFF